MNIDFITTGSRVYGPAREDSDLDIVVTIYDLPNLEEFLLKKNIKIIERKVQPKLRYTGFYFNLGGIIINIIVAENIEEMDAWNYATNKMKKLPPIKDRNKRIKMCKKLRDEYLKNL